MDLILWKIKVSMFMKKYPPLNIARIIRQKQAEMKYSTATMGKESRSFISKTHN